MILYIISSVTNKQTNNKIQKIVKLTDCTCACNAWQILNVNRRQPETEVMWIFRNFHEKSCEITLGELMFWRIFDIWNHCVPRRPLRRRFCGGGWLVGRPWLASRPLYCNRHDYRAWKTRELPLKSYYYEYNVTIMCRNDELSWRMSWVGCLLTD